MVEELEPVITDGNFDFFAQKPQEYKSIVLSTIQKILEVNTKLLSNTGKVWVEVNGQYVQQEENTLKVYYQLIDFLEDLMLFFFDDATKSVIEKENKNLTGIFQKYLEIFVKRQTNEGRKYKYQVERVIPKDDALSIWCHEQMEKEEKECYRRKLRSLLLLFKRKNELSGKRYASMITPVREEPDNPPD